MLIALIEDNRHHLGVVGYLMDRYVETHPGVHIEWEGYASGQHILDAIRRGRRFDMFFLDVLLPDIDGIEVGEEIRARNPNTPIVYVTASADRALDAFSVSALSYLLKPVREETLFPVMDRAVSLIDFTRRRPAFYLVSTPDEVRAVLRSSLVCVESQRRTLHAYLSDGSVIHSKPFRGNFESAIAPLLEDSCFLHAHKSFILNLDYVTKITSRAFTLINDMQIFIPRYKFADMKARYFEYVYSVGGGVLGDAPALRTSIFDEPIAGESSVS